MPKITIPMIGEAQRRVRTAQVDLNDLQQAYAEQECPFKIGDIVVAHEKRGVKFEVAKVCAPRWPYEGAWLVVGPITKKDGTVGTRELSLSEDTYQNRVKEQEKKNET